MLCIQEKVAFIMKKISIFLMLIISLFVVSSCSWYNKIMYDYLSDSNNYKSYHIEINGFYYFNYDNNNYEPINFGHKLESKYDRIYFSISESQNFDGGKYLINDDELSDYMVLLQIEYNNYSILIENNFFLDYKMCNLLMVNVSNLIYMDANFYYISSVSYNNKVYLNNETGLKNIIEMMDEKRSII